MLTFDDDPNMFVASKMFRQLFLGAGAAGWRGCWFRGLGHD